MKHNNGSLPKSQSIETCSIQALSVICFDHECKQSVKGAIMNKVLRKRDILIVCSSITKRKWI